MNILILEDDGYDNVTDIMLRRAGHAVHPVFKVSRLLELASQEAFDVLLLSTCVPEVTGVYVTQCLRKAHVGVPIMVLSYVDRVETKVALLNLGVDEYLTRPVHDQELLWQLKALVRRCKGTATDILQEGDLRIEFAADEVYVCEKRIRIAHHPRRVLETLGRHFGKEVRRTQLGEALYGSPYEGSTEIVEVFVRRARKALEDAKCSTPRIRTIREYGYVLQAV